MPAPPRSSAPVAANAAPLLQASDSYFGFHRAELQRACQLFTAPRNLFFTLFFKKIPFRALKELSLFSYLEINTMIQGIKIVSWRYRS
jgi:hypothetical protein